MVVMGWKPDLEKWERILSASAADSLLTAFSVYLSTVISHMVNMHRHASTPTDRLTEQKAAYTGLWQDTQLHGCIALTRASA